MTAAMPRRSLLAILGLAPAVAASGASPAAVLGRVRGLSGGHLIGRVAALEGNTLLGAAGASDPTLAPEAFAGFLEGGAGLGASAGIARALAARAVSFPPEIAAYRSFAPHLRQRLYRELLEREAARLGATSAGSPPPAREV